MTASGRNGCCFDSDGSGKCLLIPFCDPRCPDYLAVILGVDDEASLRDDITCFAPLHFACMTGDDGVIVQLLKAGADPNIRTFMYVPLRCGA